MDTFPYSILRKIGGFLVGNQDNTVMAPYNALVKELPLENQIQSKIIGRIFLTDISQVPKNWTVLFRGYPLSWNADIAQLMCTSTDPLIIYKGHLATSKLISITVKTLTSKKIKIEICKSETVEELKFRIQDKEGIAPEQMRIIFNGIQLENGRHLEELKIKDGSKLDLVLKLRGGFVAQNIEQNSVDRVGVETNQFWRLYGKGMNFVGECPNTNCVSRDNGVGQVIHASGYGVLNSDSDSDTFTFPCPACATPFPASKFILSVGKSVFRYKKIGVGNEVQWITLESLGPLHEYKTFEGQDFSNYDFIEITTVGPNATVYHCIGCHKRIEDVDDEVILSCGHPYHKACDRATSITNCAACESTPLDSFYYWLTLDDEGGVD